MAIELGVCGTYLTIGQLIRRAGLLSESDTQASSCLYRALAAAVANVSLQDATLHGARSITITLNTVRQPL